MRQLCQQHPNHQHLRERADQHQAVSCRMYNSLFREHRPVRRYRFHQRRRVLYLDKNSLSNFTLQVATRNKYLNSDSDTCINQNVSWLGSEYKTLHFYKVVDEQSYYYQVLTMANNNLVANGFNNGTTDVGLGGAFSLLATAFSSISGILAISLFPGITLGLLLFLPLIVGIIIAIIWLIKK